MGDGGTIQTAAGGLVEISDTKQVLRRYCSQRPDSQRHDSHRRRGYSRSEQGAAVGNGSASHRDPPVAPGVTAGTGAHVHQEGSLVTPERLGSTFPILAHSQRKSYERWRSS